MSQLSDLLDRIKLMNDGVITALGEGTSLRFPPARVHDAQLPLMYPIKGRFTETQDVYGRYTRQWTVTIQVLVGVRYSDTGDSNASQLITDTEDVMEAFIAYYDTHRMLTTTSLNELAFVQAPGLSYSGEGDITFFPLLEKDEYGGTTFDVVVPMTFDVGD